MSRKPKRLEPFGIKGIEVSRFRAMHDLEIGLGQLVTVIAGQNGTSKWDCGQKVGPSGPVWSPHDIQ